MQKRSIITVTENAIEQVKNLLALRGKPSAGIRISIEKGGCSGLKYKIEYADSLNEFDEKVEIGEVTILIDRKAVLHLLGTEMDFVDSKVKSGFAFTNPNKKGECGCGESFYV